jgi:hypothetical protein
MLLRGCDISVQALPDFIVVLDQITDGLAPYPRVFVECV